MKKTLLAVFAVAIAISASAFKPLVTELFVSVSAITDLNVSSSASYQESQGTITCQTLEVKQPCKLDLTLIDPLLGVDTEAEFLNYLATQFTNDPDRVAEVNRIAIEWKP